MRGIDSVDKGNAEVGRTCAVDPAISLGVRRTLRDVPFQFLFMRVLQCLPQDRFLCERFGMVSHHLLVRKPTPTAPMRAGTPGQTRFSQTARISTASSLNSRFDTSSSWI